MKLDKPRSNLKSSAINNFLSLQKGFSSVCCRWTWRTFTSSVDGRIFAAITTAGLFSPIKESDDSGKCFSYSESEFSFSPVIPDLFSFHFLSCDWIFLFDFLPSENDLSGADGFLIEFQFRSRINKKAEKVFRWERKSPGKFILHVFFESLVQFTDKVTNEDLKFNWGARIEKFTKGSSRRSMSTSF